MANFADLLIRVTSDASGVRIGMAQTRSELEKTERQAEQTGRAVRNVGEHLNTAANFALGAGAALAGGIALSMKSTIAYGQAVDDIADVSNLSAKAASTLTGQMQYFDLSAKSAGTSVKFFEKNLDAARQGNDETAEAFARLGISAGELEKFSDAELLFKTRDAMSELGDKTARTAITLQLFGRSGADLSDWLDAAPSDIAEVNKLLEESGLIWDGKAIDSWQDMIDAQREMRISMLGLQTAISDPELIGSLSTLVREFSRLLQFARPLMPMLPYLVTALVGFGGAVKAIRMYQWLRDLARSTGLIAAQTVAIEANTTARKLNNKVPAAPPLAAAGSSTGSGLLGAAGGSLAAGTAASIAGITAAAVAVASSPFIIGLIVEKTVGNARFGKTVENETHKAMITGGSKGGGVSGGGRWAAYRQSQEDRAARQRDAAQWHDAIVASHDSTSAVSKAESAVRDSTKAAEQLKGAVEDNTAATRESIVSTAKSTFDAMVQANAAGIRLTATELAAVMNNSKPPAAASSSSGGSGTFQAGQTGVKYHEFARGGSGVTSGPMLALIGEAGPEPYAIGKDHVGGDVVFKDCTFSARSPRELMDLMKRELARDVRYANG